MAGPCPCGGDQWDETGYAAAWGKRRCTRCGLLTPAKPPCSRDLTAWYETEYWKHYCEEQTGTERDNLYAHALAWLDRESPGRGAVLDVGCGGGRFLSLCRADGWQAVGVEPSPEAAAHARRRGIEVHGRSWPVPSLPDESFDAVTFINVLDHLPDPFEALREARRVLKLGGLLYVRVPNAPLHAWLRRLFVSGGLGTMAVLHLYGFGRRTFKLLLPRIGFTPIAVRTAPPASGYPYQNRVVPPAWQFRALKRADQAAYWLSRLLGLDRLGWGPSLEVLAKKTSVFMGGHP
ncbi:MAG: class I SAM-dependent methyltransferase [Armatimonadota bacterium]|nr:class I SAM-dependent methyltransferase [Armatimonadota bacterium]